VTTARCKTTGQCVVVKKYTKLDLGALALLQVQTEIDILHSLAGPHVVALVVAFEDDRHISVVLEQADGGDLRCHMRRGHYMKEARLRDFIVTPVLRALASLQHEGVVHRDLKPENVLVHGDQVMLADFGMAMYYCVPPPCASESNQDPAAARALACLKLASNAGGTMLYSAPETLLAMFCGKSMQPMVQHKNDVWALGVMIVEALTGEHPFSPEKCTRYQGNVMYSIAHCKAVDLPRNITPELRDFLSQTLQTEPELRPSAEELLHHPWLSASIASPIPLLPQLVGKDLPRACSALAIDCGTTDTFTCDDSDDTAFQEYQELEDHAQGHVARHAAQVAVLSNIEELTPTKNQRLAFEELECWGD